MKDTLNKVSDLTRTSMHDLKRILSLLKLVVLIEAANSKEDSDCSKAMKGDTALVANIPFFGKLRISEDFDFSFIPDSDFKKDLYQVKECPEAFFKKELRNLLKITDKKEKV